MVEKEFYYDFFLFVLEAILSEDLDDLLKIETGDGDYDKILYVATYLFYTIVNQTIIENKKMVQQNQLSDIITHNKARMKALFISFLMGRENFYKIDGIGSTIAIEDMIANPKMKIKRRTSPILSKKEKLQIENVIKEKIGCYKLKVIGKYGTIHKAFARFKYNPNIVNFIIQAHYNIIAYALYSNKYSDYIKKYFSRVCLRCLLKSEVKDLNLFSLINFAIEKRFTKGEKKIGLQYLDIETFNFCYEKFGKYIGVLIKKQLEKYKTKKPNGK